MRIIKQGKKPEDKFVGTCNLCHSEIEAERSELKISDGCYRNDNQEYGTGFCPVCEKSMTFTPVKV